MSNRKRLNNEGFTLAEVMVAAFVLIVGMLGVMFSFVKAIELSEIAKNTSMAVTGTKARIETIKNSAPTAMSGTYNGVTFAINGLNGIGVSLIDDTTDPDLVQIIVVFCWIEKGGRIIGEDLDMDGVLDGGDDTNGDLRLSSPVELVTQVFSG